MKVILVGVIVGLVFGWAVGEMRGENRGFDKGVKYALTTNPPSPELEMICAGLWIGEQNKKYWKKTNAN